MRRIRKSKKLDPLCEAVRRVRQASNWSQEEIARVAGISMQTWSRFERGVQVPKNVDVLIRLASAAALVNLRDEQELFQSAAREKRGPSPLEISTFTEPQQWRLMQIVRVAWAFYPGSVEALEKAIRQAAPEAVSLLDEVIAEAPEDAQWTEQFCNELEYQVSMRGARRVLRLMKGEPR